MIQNLSRLESFNHLTFEKFLQPTKITTNSKLSRCRQNNEEKDSFQDLPDEILLKIFTHLSPYHLVMCSLVNLQFNSVSQDWILWKHFFESNLDLLDFGDLVASRYGKYKYKITTRLGFFPEKSTQSYLFDLREAPIILSNSNKESHTFEGEKEKEKTIREFELKKQQQLLKRLSGEPLKFFVEQVQKYRNAKLIHEKFEVYSKRITKIDRMKNKIPNFITDGAFLVLSCSFSLVYLFCKLKWFENWPWSPFFSFFIIASLYLFCVFAILQTTQNRLDYEMEKQEQFLILTLLSLSLLINFSLLSLRLDGYTTISYLTILNMFFVPLFFAYFFILACFYSDEMGNLQNRNLDYFLILIQCLVPIYLFSFYLFFHFAIQRVHFQMDVSWIRIFSILFVTNLSPFIVIISLKLLDSFTNFNLNYHTNLVKESLVFSLVITIPFSILILFFMLIFLKIQK
ncbi:f-box only protein [Anaeramoeba flamelloides]|uniref:F-box only protein n=1 Tax=Anaeramoeba flamelloides TaxID=1746091 RepID=A0ABQ8ZAJ3_9EUKA|nr:f-box only protein [Anaeramoeba flamelloides]